ncbi:FadR family transcriptional regulator [Pedobacter hiemivivus]|uniref:FadR family transcriptional regulator n=1 Tax=Pedobacter hiemivivus TaxID=2530454 RepID=A0A4U1GGM8_9SPHI|nr:FadR/GntR family transcriptional regulator [Pedobacter hiemivivus]TCC86738.1 FadR family transcriptional regulator [Pedobacter hiemivivus]TKC62269.1 FadR family transcriptional regulator [Pedobacter hiemivivus]
MIKRKSLADEVASKIQEQISFGKYKVNEKLPIEPELMKGFGVGRSTIREAIKILANSGLLRVQQGIGTFVEQSTSNREPMEQRLKRANVQDLDEVRQLLEMKIAEKAAMNRTDSDIIAIKAHLENRKKSAAAGLIEDCIEADVQFHIAIAEASKNEILADLYRSTSIHLKNWFLQIYPDTAVFEETYALHEQLLKSIIAGDAKKAWSIAAKIIGHVSQ